MPTRSALPEPYEKTTRHTITLDGREWRYDATLGTITIDTAKVKPAASIFFAAFNAVDDQGATDPTRPVTFIFNGGPGSSSTFLLLGSIAPKRIDVTDTDPVPAAPYTLADNPETLLPVSDLVFIDAAGAGFSTILDKAKPELWSVDGDVKGFSAFIRAYLSKYRRWNSPKYVLGESYGTTRGAALAYRLQQDGVSLNGLTLISNILDYAHVFDTSDQCYVGYFPTYASVAHYHGKAGQGLTLEEHLAQARAFADGPLRLALAAGARLDDGTKRRVAERYAELTGLDADYVFASDLRVLDTRFRKRLLLDRSRIVGRYDAAPPGMISTRSATTRPSWSMMSTSTLRIPAWSMLICATSWAGTASPSVGGSRISTGNPPNRARGGCGGTACPRTPSALRARSSRSRRSRPTWPRRSCTSPRSRC